MKNIGRTRWLFCLGLFCLALSAGPGFAAETDGAGSADKGEARQMLQELLDAVQAGNFEAFTASGEDAFKSGVAPESFSALAQGLGPRLRQGYEASYLGWLRQQGCEVHLWKLVHADGGDDTLSTLAVRGGKVAGFWLR